MITVVLPVYNGEKYLEDSIRSVLGQNEESFELIIINDASTDNSLKIISNFLEHPRVIFINNKSNKGLFPTLNIGINKARGSFIKLWAQDDIMKDNCLNNFIKAFKSHENSSFIWCLSTKITSDSSYNNLLSSRKFNEDKVIDLKYENWEFMTVIRHFWFCGSLHGNISNLGFSKKVWSLIGGFNEEMIYSGDIDFTLRSLNVNMPICLPSELVWLRDHNEQLSKNKEKLIFELKETLEVFGHLEKLTLETKNNSILTFSNKCKWDRLYPYYTSNALKVIKTNFKVGFIMLKLIAEKSSILLILLNWIRVKTIRLFSPKKGLVKLFDFPF
jgi:glycosyltransferase involved in cell wall biosynthesis